MPFWTYTEKQRVYEKRQVHLKMYAVIETGGKQYQVNEGDVVFH